MARTSAGILPFRRRNGELQVLLVHPGGPFFARRDEGVWSIPKGEPHDGESYLDAARREFAEETGFTVSGPFLPLEPVVQRGGKRVHAWAAEGDWDPACLRSNVCTIEYPLHSGRLMEIPEVDRAEWYALDVAAQKINPAQVVWLTQLTDALKSQAS